MNKHNCISNNEMEHANCLTTVDRLVRRFGPEEAVKITVDILRKMNQNDLAEQLEKKHKTGPTKEESKASRYTEFSLRLKSKLKQDYEKILVGNSERGHRKNLTDIYTNLYVVENETGGIVNEHEVRQIEMSGNRFAATDTLIHCNNIFKAQHDMARQNRKVLTLGIAGVGKTISVNKFILDWAEGKENQDIILIFPIPFRRLNLIKQECSLMELLHNCFFSGPDKLSSLPEGDGKVMFIFDGLDECRFPLRFNENDGFTDVDQKTTVSSIVTNLIERHLVSSALIWITSRPAAASLIPRDYIDLVTEVRGFSEEQREQYFKKNNDSLEGAENIICHIRKYRSLYIMCHIPVFCWISLTVLQPLLAQESSEKKPTTLTGMYTNFLLFQQQQMKKKYSDDPNAKYFDQFFLKLGKLAFQQLEKGNLIFYKEDLEECGLDINEGSVYCGLCTQIFQQEEAVTARSAYSFIHLSVQEFLAALYVFFKNKDKKENPFRESRKKLTVPFRGNSMFQLHKDAIKKALQSENGHLDLFLRFLLGLSLESNQSYLKELLPTLQLKIENVKDTADYIKNKIEKEKSVEKTINLFHCLNELKDDFMEEIQKNLSSGNLSAQNLSSAQWSGLVFVLLMSEETQNKFELQKYGRSVEALMRLVLVIKNTRRALLHSCNLTAQSCESLSSVLQSSDSVLRELDLSNNDLHDYGVKLLSDGLKSANCQLEILRLHSCNLTAESCDSFLSALQSSNSVLRELDLSNNYLKDSGMKLLSDGLKSPNCQLEILRLPGCMLTEEGCGYVSSALSSNTSHLKALDLSYNQPGEQGVRRLSDTLNHPNCKLEKLKLQFCNLTSESCESLSSPLQSSNSVLKELDLTNNDLQDSGVKFLSDGLKSPNCQLEILRLSGCMVTEKGCGYVSSALCSNHSQLKELDLSYNYPGDSGVKLLNHPNCKLNKLNVDHGGEFRITAGLHKYACILTLDPNTANTYLVLSEENRKVTRVKEKQPYPEHPERFDECPQFLCRESPTGRCYWEAEWSEYVEISVTYKGISRKGGSDDCGFGLNKNSWSLFCSDDRFTRCHNGNFTDICVPSGSSNRVGVYVDVSAGNLSFYSVSDTHTLTHLHTFTTTFTESLYAGFRLVDCGSSVSL
ncbi:protein NLRC3-like [Garra rufa]|uniref:protein NLRC3-like n=1 Tax=Garra rufa TaxID=137080 RepID=UPI003CCEDE99